MQFSNINYNLYKSFLVVYETGNISKAAELLYISQPAVSHNIKELEKQLGIQLFYKKSNGMSATNEANILYKYISSAFNSIWKGETTISDMAGLKTGIVRIGTHSYLSVLFLSKIITEFRQKFPNIKIEITCKSSNELLSMLQTQNIDVLIENQPIMFEKGNIEVKYLKSFSHCFISTEKFSNGKVFTLDSIGNLPLIISSNNSEEIKLLKNSLPELKINPIIEAGSAEAVLKLVKDGNGIGYIQEEYAKADIENEIVKKLDISFSLPKLDVYCGYTVDMPAYAPKKFIEWIISKNLF